MVFVFMVVVCFRYFVFEFVRFRRGLLSLFILVFGNYCFRFFRVFFYSSCEWYSDFFVVWRWYIFVVGDLVLLFIFVFMF